MKEIEVKHIYDNVYTITAETIRTDGLIRDMADQGLYVTAIVVNPGLTFTYNVRYEPKEERFDVIGFIIAYENGELDDDEIVNGYKHLIQSGIVWELQGFYQRQALEFIRLGIIE